MQVQANYFGSSQAQVSGVSGANGSSQVKPNSAIDAAEQIERVKQGQGLEKALIDANSASKDIHDTQGGVQLFEQTTPEQLSNRLGAKLEYERAIQGSEGAVAHYLANEHAAAREEIQQMVGIDTYA
ncbi:conserved hypothetical protein [Shewanella woodyi ATCC 51908]|uniref:Uncharacterized protein n=2 Tax=Shewanella woodyi TaxID=60961 RepID=B1KRI3_SHEWM|nr:conserved hypothetical protein [Shewanella woodyi ATCC 51908]